MGGVIEIFMMACFCLVAGYLLGYVQRIERNTERIAEATEQLAKTTATVAGLPVEQPPLPTGMYALGEIQKDGSQALVPMRSR